MSREIKPVLDIDRTLHEPARLLIAALLYNVEEADFLFLLNESGLTKGNLSSHLARLEESGYVAVEKGYRGKIPRTLARLTPQGRAAFESYRRNLKSVVAGLG